MRYPLRPRGLYQAPQQIVVDTEAARPIPQIVIVLTRPNPRNRFSRSLAMNSPNPAALPFSKHRCRCLLLFILSTSLAFSGCGKTTKGDPNLAPAKPVEVKKPVIPVSTWLGNAERNFYGTGPWKDGQLEIVWEFKTSSTSGRLHKDPWGGTSWPGQPSVEGDRVYFPSADGNTYCLNKADGSLVWKFKAKDSQKATPTIVGDRVVDNGLDHHVYCLNKKDGSLIWNHETGFEVDGAMAASEAEGRLYFGGEDHNFYCLNLSDGSLVYKVLVGSVEGSVTFKDGRIYLGTEQGDLFCLNPADGKVIWKARIGADSDSTPAVINGMVYTAAEDGVVRAYKQDTGELVWNYVTEGGHLGRASEHIGIWASPIFYKGRIYIGAGNGYLHCLSADKGELVWRFKARGPIWGTSPIVDGRVVFGDKAGWIHLLSAEDGTQISEIKIGDNINSTPAVVDGRIYIGAFNGKLYCLEMGNTKPAADTTKQEAGSTAKQPKGRKHRGVGKKRKSVHRK